jgi:hypothetical protein
MPEAPYHNHSWKPSAFSRQADREFTQSMWKDVNHILGSLTAAVPAMVAQYVGPPFMAPVSDLSALSLNVDALAASLKHRPLYTSGTEGVFYVSGTLM